MHIETNQLTSLTARSYCWRLCVNKQNISGTDVRGGWGGGGQDCNRGYKGLSSSYILGAKMVLKIQIGHGCVHFGLCFRRLIKIN